MGRITQIIDFLNIKPLPPPIERLIRYSKISDEETLKRLRKELNSHSDIETDENPELFF
jgi:hypothetical protein